ncbi:MAG TPA: alpha/beta fold hydrolase [Anaerolineales bacterium]|jgi:carboxylesterase|nr:alpha/beta fold hydrolase [Anaerolineales bacterium]
MSQIIPTAEPFFFPGEPSKPACLLIHGFTGTPKEMRGMGEYLHRQGYTCLGIRLAGHATLPEDMIRSRWTDWTASVEDGYNLLCGLTDDIFLIGLSMGGILSLLMSTRLRVKGVIAMSTPARMPSDYPIWLMKLVSLVIPYRPKTSGPPGSGWFDKAAYRDNITYEKNPVRSAAELKRLILEMRAALPKVKVPVLLMHSRDETYILPDNIEYIYDRLVNTPDKTKLYITGSGHNLTRDASREQVFETAGAFLQRVSIQK